MAGSKSVGPLLMGGASFRSFRCIWMLEELGIPYRHSLAMPGSKDVKQHNPLGKVPVLVEEDGFAIYESTAINTYLGDKYRHINPTLVPPAGTRERGLYDQTVSVLNTEMDAQGLWVQRKHETMGHIFTHIPEAVIHARKYFHKTNRALVSQLRDGGPFLLGQNFTAADICYVHCLDWSKSIGWNDKWKDDTAVLDYLELCKTRPAYLKVRGMRDAEQAAMKKGSSKL